MSVNPARSAAAASRLGFTLVELLVVISIIALLLALVLPTLGVAREHARMIVELSAARNLMAGHAIYAQDHQEHLIPGYDVRAEAAGPAGEPLTFPTNARYPWRLVPYLGGELEQTVLVHQRLDESRRGDRLDTYGISVTPSFGINGEFVGGTWGGPYNNWLTGVGVTVQRAADAAKPAQLITFTSARGGVSGLDPTLGYHLVQPAYGQAYTKADLPARFGFVHPRYWGHAVTGFLDGHAGLLDTDALRDTTLWSDAAARAGNPGWTPRDAAR